MASQSDSMPPLKEETRPCSQCRHGRVALSDHRKMCDQCREKGRIHAARRAEKLRALASGNLEPVVQPLALAVVNGKRKAENGPEVLQGIKKQFKKSYAAPSATPSHKDAGNSSRGFKVRHDDTEYQTATEMYKAIKALSMSKKVQFRGSFSIVAKADTDNITRARLVTNELRKIAKIPFEHDNPVNPVSGDSYRVAFKCTCLAPPVPRPVATNPYPDVVATAIPGTGMLKAKQSDLTSWAGLKSKNTGAEATCKGKVVIFAENDASHFLGIKGQKVTVTIEH